MEANFDKAINEIFHYDGLRNDSAPGENFATSFGVTNMTWNNAMEQGIVTGEMSAAPVASFIAIYRTMFWNACRCDRLPAGVDLMVFNDATLSGVGHTSRLLQRIVGTDPDGIIGPITMKAVMAITPDVLIERLHVADHQYLASLANAPRFLRGWTRREDEMVLAAHEWDRNAA